MQRWGTGAPRLAAAGLRAGLLAAVLPGCRTAGPDFVRPSMAPALAGWNGGALAPLAAGVQARQARFTTQWWRSFNDPALDALAAQVAGLYSTIRTLEVRLAIAAQNAALLRRSLDITEGLFKGGIESELDVQQARTLYLSMLAGVPQFEASLRQAQNALATLLARAPEPLPEMTAGAHAAGDPYRDPIPNARLELIVDLPAGMLRRRPDVRALEMQMAAQSALMASAPPTVSVDLAARFARPGGDLDQRRAPRAGLGLRVRHGLERVRPRPPDHTVLLQDARFQQLYEQYQDAVLRAAREVHDAAAGFARTGEQIALLADSVDAARRALDLATLQYREGLADFQRVIDSQRAFFGQQELLVTSRGNLAQNLVALYKAMGGGWEEGRARPVLDEATRAAMQRRSGWEGLLEAPLPPTMRPPGTEKP